MTNRAKQFVINTIVQNDILMINMLTYYLSTRPLDEMLFKTISNTQKFDTYLENAKLHFEILPPISQSNEDMAYTLVSFMNVLFTKEQIISTNNHNAIVLLNDVIKTNL